MLFFELIRVSLGRGDRLSMVPSASEWQYLYELSIQHALAGICYQGVVRLPSEQRPPADILMDWLWQVQRIREQNLLVDQRCVEAVRRLEADGFDVCVLKGQGNALLYGTLAGCRHPGDVDLWTVPRQTPYNQRRHRVIDYVRSRHPKSKLRYHHIEYPLFDDVEVELHFEPIYLNNPWLNRRLRKWFDQQRQRQMLHRVALAGVELPVPTREFNVVYQLLHILKHIFEEGIGLRQLMDYYFVLLASDEGVPDAAASAETERLLGSLHLEVLAGAVMYVLQTVMDLPDHLLLCAPRREEGMALLSEIMQAGNFGHYDTRATTDDAGDDWRSQLHRYWRKTRRNIVIAMQYPHEGLWEPLFHLYQYWWRRGNDK